LIINDLEFHLEHARESMGKALKHLEDELTKIRAGKASPQMLDGIMVDYYGTPTPLNQVSTINTPDAKTLSIKPWEKKMLEPIEKAVFAANLGVTPVNDGETIRIIMPPLTEERRKEMVKKENMPKFQSGIHEEMQMNTSNRFKKTVFLKML
jgi:ribosome recycling factor